MADPCCGTCRYYAEFPGYEDGECRWAEHRVLPSCMADRAWPVDRGDGLTCRAWQGKEAP